MNMQLLWLCEIIIKMTYDNLKEIITLILAPISALGGVWLASYLSSKNDNKNFIAKEIMLKKLEYYEQLFTLMRTADDETRQLFDLASKAKTKRELIKIPDAVFPAGLAIAQYTDDHKLYLDEDVAIHITATFLAPSEIYALDPASKTFANKVKKLQSLYNEQYAQGVELIAEYAGFKRLEKTYKKINKPTASSQIIDYANEIRMQIGKTK